MEMIHSRNFTRKTEISFAKEHVEIFKWQTRYLKITYKRQKRVPLSKIQTKTTIRGRFRCLKSRRKNHLVFEVLKKSLVSFQGHNPSNSFIFFYFLNLCNILITRRIKQNCKKRKIFLLMINAWQTISSVAFMYLLLVFFR